MVSKTGKKYSLPRMEAQGGGFAVRGLTLHLWSPFPHS